MYCRNWRRFVANEALALGCARMLAGLEELNLLGETEI